MNIEVRGENTPNPAAMRFALTGREVMGNTASVSMTSPQEAACSPLAQILFDIPGVEKVYYGSNFVTVQNPSADWPALTPAVASTIRDYFAANSRLITGPVPPRPAETPITAEGSNFVEEELGLIVAAIRDTLETANEKLSLEGGEAIFRYYDPIALLVYITLQGSCAGCPSSTITMKDGIENLLRDSLGDDAFAGLRAIPPTEMAPVSVTQTESAAAANLLPKEERNRQAAAAFLKSHPEAKLPTGTTIPPDARTEKRKGFAASIFRFGRT